MASVTKLQQMLECPECAELYQSPHILNCQHTVCLECIDKIKNEEDVVKCPVCDVTSNIDDVKRDINKEQLLLVCSSEKVGSQPQHKLEGPISEQDEDISSETESDQHNYDGPKCELCDKRIAWFCAQCDQWFCNECKARHVKTTATRYHKLEHLNNVARKHRQRLEVHYFTFKRAHERLTKLVGNVDAELLNSATALGAALFTTKEIRQDWINKINQYFDSLDVKITDFAQSRIHDLKRLKDRLDSLHTDLSNKSVYLSDYMTQYSSVIINTSSQVCRDMNNYVTDTQVPSVDIKAFTVKVIKGKHFEGKQIATVEVSGGHSVITSPLAPSSYDNHKQELRPGQRKPKHIDPRPAQGGQKTPRRHDEPSGSQTPRRTPVAKPQKKTIPKPLAILNSLTGQELVTPTPPAPPPRVESLKQFTPAQLRSETDVLLTSKASNIRCIDGVLWVSQANCITLWSSELEEKRIIQHQLMKNINSVTPMRKGGYVVACENGLHLLAKSYRYDGRVTDDHITDVVSGDHYIYASHYKEKVRAKISVFDERIANWSTVRSIRTAIPGKVTLLLLEDNLYVCSMEQGAIQVMTLQGELLRKIGKKGKFGGPGELFEPRLCQFDQEGTILISDTKNENLQIMTSEGQWEIIKFSDSVSAPPGACFWRRHLFVLQSGAEHKLTKYSA